LINFWNTKNNKNLASHIGETKKSKKEVNLKDSVVNNRDIKEEMSFLYNKYTKNNRNCFVFSPNTKLITIKKHYSPSSQEWTNSVYAYNSKITILLSAIDKIVIKLIKSYFNAYFFSNKIRKFRPRGAGALQRRSRALNKIFVSNLVLKHTNSNVAITVFINCEEEVNLESLYRDLMKNTKDSFLGLLAKIYNKKVNMEVVRLRRPELNASILAERLATELIKGRGNALRVLRRALKRVKIPKFNLKRYYFKRVALVTKNYNELYNSICGSSSVVFNKINKALERKKIISTMRHGKIMGLKIQITGRLTRRATAAKAVIKSGQVGSLKNMDSSVAGLPVGLLIGYHRPNVQKAYYNSKTKNGSFNVRVWTSSFYSTLAARTKREI
jgi:hypothetical protein